MGWRRRRGGSTFAFSGGGAHEDAWGLHLRGSFRRAGRARGFAADHSFQLGARSPSRRYGREEADPDGLRDELRERGPSGSGRVHALAGPARRRRLAALRAHDRGLHEHRLVWQQRSVRDLGAFSRAAGVHRAEGLPWSRQRGHYRSEPGRVRSLGRLVHRDPDPRRLARFGSEDQLTLEDDVPDERCARGLPILDRRRERRCLGRGRVSRRCRRLPGARHRGPYRAGFGSGEIPFEDRRRAAAGATYRSGRSIGVDIHKVRRAAEAACRRSSGPCGPGFEGRRERDSAGSRARRYEGPDSCSGHLSRRLRLAPGDPGRPRLCPSGSPQPGRQTEHRRRIAPPAERRRVGARHLPAGVRVA